MKVLVVGATGRTGRLVVQAAVDAGHHVRAFARSVSTSNVPDGVDAVPGDVCDAAAVQAAVQGMDAVIVALSMVRTSDNPWARITTPVDLHTQAAATLIPACEAAGVQRYLTISAHGVGPSRPRAGWAFVLTIRDMGQLSLEGAKRESEKLVQVWQSNWEGLGEDDAAVQAISDQVDALRAAVLEELAALE